MKKKTTKHYTLSAILLLSLTAYFTNNNNDTLQKIVTKLEQYSLKTPQEKVYLHFDKPYYMAGETIWYAGYLFDAINHGIDSVSTVLYVDLIDPSVGKVLQSLTLKCQSGMTQGSFVLPDNLPQGTYQVRAFTSYMRNHDDSYFFKRDIKVWQSKPGKATDAEYEQLAKVARPEFRSLPLTGPVVVAASEPTDAKERDYVATGAMFGMDLQFFPQHYRAYGDAQSKVLAHARALTVFQKINPSGLKDIEAVLVQLKKNPQDVVFLPCNAKQKSMTALLDAKTGEIIKILLVRPPI